MHHARDRGRDDRGPGRVLVCSRRPQSGGMVQGRRKRVRGRQHQRRRSEDPARGLRAVRESGGALRTAQGNPGRGQAHTKPCRRAGALGAPRGERRPGCRYARPEVRGRSIAAPRRNGPAIGSTDGYRAADNPTATTRRRCRTGRDARKACAVGSPNSAVGSPNSAAGPTEDVGCRGAGRHSACHRSAGDRRRNLPTTP